VTPGRDYWLRVLSPYVRDGYHYGMLDDLEVVLVNEIGAEVHLPRPSAAWHLPLLPSLDGLDGDRDTEATTRGVKWLMQVDRDRMELTA
jgi:hypothetical protein